MSSNQSGCQQTKYQIIQLIETEMAEVKLT